MNLQQLLREQDIELPKSLSLQGIGKLLDYLSEKIPARINTTTHYIQERDPYL